MGWGITIILIFSGLLGIMIKLYENHVDYLNKEIKDLQFELDLTTECLDAHVEMVDDLEGYYEKWREAAIKLDKINQKILELNRENKNLKMKNAALEIINEELEQRIHCFEEYE